MQTRTRLLGALLTSAAVLGAMTLMLRSGSDGSDDPGATESGPETAAATASTTTTTTTTTEPPTDETGPIAVSPHTAPPVAVIVEVGGQIERWSPDGTVETLLDEIGEGELVAVSADGDALVSRPAEDGSIRGFDIIRASGSVESVPVDPAGRTWVVVVDSSGDTTTIVFATLDEATESGDLLELDLTTGTVTTAQAGVVAIDQNALPVARAAGVEVLEWVWHLEYEYLWTADYELLISGPDGTSLPSPTDGRYGEGYGAEASPLCTGWNVQRRDFTADVTLDSEGARLVWRNQIFDASQPGGPVSESLRVLRLADGADGEIPIPDGSGALVGVVGPTAVFERGFLDLASGGSVPVARGDVVAVVAGQRSDEHVVPASPIGELSCRPPELTIYGLGDLRAGGAPSFALDDFSASAATPNCHRLFATIGDIRVLTSDQGDVRAVDVRNGSITTPSGITSGTTVAEIWARFEDQLAVVPAGVDPVTSPTDVTALDFVPNAAEEGDLGLRFGIAGGRVVSMVGGERTATRSTWDC